MQRILVVRNDKLGDFMLTWPAFALLKQALPQCHITALVSAYTREMAEACPWIDAVQLDTRPADDKRGAALAKALRANAYDAAITLFSTGRIGLALWRAGIPYRLAPATKLAQFLYNQRLVQRRSRSEKPEWEYNVELVRQFLTDQQVAAPSLPEPPYLHFADIEVAELRREYCANNAIPPESRLILVHPGSGGSAVNISLAQYAELIQALAGEQRHFILSAGPGEEARCRELASLINGIPHSLYTSHTGLRDFARHIQFCDLYISGSTGPLHIAGALDVPTAGFYSRRRSATPLRWQTLNSPDRRLAFTPPEDADELDMGRIDVVAAAEQIESLLR